MARPVALPATFSFVWMDIQFDGLVQKDDLNDGPPKLRLTGDLGSVPFTAEDASRRARLFALGYLKLVDQARFLVSDGSDIKFVHEKELDDPVTEMMVLGETAALLAQAKPYLEIAARKSPIASNARTPKRLR
ncbi:MAG: hypothetical protein HOB82_03535 [Alphaproteobacteria bacterium]|nr:hypothetical protein [Alphaproteobacteria bacterium]MBT5860910.1 hypothetical protein [Alphaproteobacteria bacterium]